jgi:hypothetical protein
MYAILKNDGLLSWLGRASVLISLINYYTIRLGYVGMRLDWIIVEHVWLSRWRAWLKNLKRRTALLLCPVRISPGRQHERAKEEKLYSSFKQEMI